MNTSHKNLHLKLHYPTVRRSSSVRHSCIQFLLVIPALYSIPTYDRTYGLGSCTELHYNFTDFAVHALYLLLH